jgi:hypothetical protein
MDIEIGATDNDSLGSDLLRGAKKIGDFIDEPEKRVYYLFERGIIPLGRQGNQLIGSKRQLRKYYEQLTQGVPPPAQSQSRLRSHATRYRGHRRHRAEGTEGE